MKPRNKYKHLTTGTLKQIDKLRAEGLTVKQIAVKMDRTYDSIRGAIKRSGIKRAYRKMSELEQALILSGDKPANISKIIGVSAQKITAWRFRHKHLRSGEYVK